MTGIRTLPSQKVALCLPSCSGHNAAQPGESGEGKASEMGSSREVGGTMEQGAMLPPAAEDGGPRSTQGAQLGGSCCLTHLQAAGGQWDAAGRPQGCCLCS